MKNLYKITPKNRWRIILGLSVVLLLIFLTSLFENKQLKEINESFGSLYKDRLIPASEIYQINTYFTQKSFVLEELKNVNDSLSFNFSPLLLKNNKKIDSLLKAYEETYFVKEEKLAFVKFKENYEDYQKKEVLVTQGMKNCELSISEKKDIGEALVFLNKINVNLAELVAIQSSVGKELLDDSKFNFGSSTLLFYFRFGLTLLVTAGILLLVKTSETNQRKKDPHINTMKVIKNKKNL
ncbi:chemoreceptor-like protein with four helix bundle sensory module [Mesonia algae]|uniref:Chemoreceptor-like protein with four helix bundle sensory module n=1 Tax=Mesonia algae TaxID=213248 RepID=A0A2W7I2Y2_9FLAO|nr:MCP four helix bundle domain-containing protein [Mesonia algae]PZW39635.1 chemoreceptor-like protein with four helix bundle sensory module [Mesonia algae]